MAPRKKVEAKPGAEGLGRSDDADETADEDLVDDWFEPEDPEDLPPADAARRDELEVSSDIRNGPLGVMRN